MEALSGIVIVNKDKGFTSHDVVNVIRKILNIKKVGHTGTLDPDATGVLPVCVGKATKVADMLMLSDKEYIASVKLGVTTDTQDMTGTVLESHAVSVSLQDIQTAVTDFIGEISQIPPMYSAIKINGKKMYELARKGIEVERKPRQIKIHSISVSDFVGDSFTIRVCCSKGTYIRTLCHDLGQKLGCGAAMQSLQRTKTSMFSIEQALTLDEIRDKVEKNGKQSVLMPTDSVFGCYKELKLDGELKKRLCNGASSTVRYEEGIYRVYDLSDTFLCIAEVKKAENDKKILKLVKAFYE